MSNMLFIRIGVIFHLICALFHFFYPRIFHWEENLKELPENKKKVIKQNLNLSNYSMLLFWLMLAYMPFFYTGELLNSAIGRAFLTCIVLFWVIRIFILQPVIAGLKTKESWLRTIFFLAGFLCFFIPWLRVFLWK